MMSGVPSQKTKLIALENADFAREMLAKTMFARAFEEKALALTQTNPPQVKGSMHFCAGQELLAMAAVAGLGPDDQILSTYRGHGWALAAGLDPYAVFAEICQKADGINGGRGGSAYFMAPDTRFIGENSIVGAGTTIACGVALANASAQNGRVVVVSIGDGALNQGAAHEAMAFAAVKNLGIIFVVENNGWSELTATSDMFRIDRLAQRATGYGIPSATISGIDAIAVRDSFRLAAERARKGEGPSLLECKVPRLWGHYNRDIEHYRAKSDRQEAESRDPITVLIGQLIASDIMTVAEIERLRSEQLARIEKISKDVMASSDPSELPATIAASSSQYIPDIIETKQLTYIEAVNTALRAELVNEPNTLVYGEDCGKSGGIFAACRYLQRDFGAERVFDMPIAENAILGSAVGAALCGMKPIVEIMWADFIFVALDQLINQAANVRFITAGKSSVPIVVRTQQGVTPGSCAQHSQSIEAILAHIPGLKVALAATAEDAYALLRAAAADPDPCVVIEARSLYPIKGDVTLTKNAEPVGRARLRRTGSDIAILTWGTMVPVALAAAELMAAENIDTAVLDLRWLAPLDRTALLDTVRTAGGRALVVHEAVQTGGFGAEICLIVQEALGKEMPINIRRHCSADSRIPAAPSLQEKVIPNASSIISAVKSIM
jgi:2-oxoisovalerate dehydrogenase E1 component